MKKYFLHEGATQEGPFSLEELRAKKITAGTAVWFHPMPEWKPAGEIEELKNIFNPDPSPVLPVTPLVVPPKEEDWSRKQYYFADSTGQQGPFKLEQLTGKNIHSDTPIWYDGIAEWTTAGKVAGLKDILNKPSVVPEIIAEKDAEKPTPMKVKFAIRKEKEKSGMFSGKEADMYILSATFTLSEREKNIYNEHPLFKEMVFMEYNELDRWAPGRIAGDKQIEDTAKQILVDSIYTSPTLTFSAYSVERIAELRTRIIEASENFVKKIKMLETLEGSDEMEFKVPG